MRSCKALFLSHMNYDKFPIGTNGLNLQIHLNAFSFSLSTGVTGFVHDISRYIHEGHDLYGIYMIFTEPGVAEAVLQAPLH